MKKLNSILSLFLVGILVMSFISIAGASGDAPVKVANTPIARNAEVLAPPHLPYATNPVPPDTKTYTKLTPIKLFDDVYFVGTNSVGMFIFDTGAGLVTIDSGNGPVDGAIMAQSMQELGLDPTQIKMIIVSHEHGDHQGGVNYWLENWCPNAKVAQSVAGWNYTQNAVAEGISGPGPKRLDIALEDGMRLRHGNFTIQPVATPGHSTGCMSFIFPVSINGENHMAALMGGNVVWGTQSQTREYQTSIKYFKLFTDAAKCDVGLSMPGPIYAGAGVHLKAADVAALIAAAGGPHPMLYDGQRFDTEYLQKYRDFVAKTLSYGTYDYNAIVADQGPNKMMPSPPPLPLR
jgi:hypothetical protein